MPLKRRGGRTVGLLLAVATMSLVQACKKDPPPTCATVAERATTILEKEQGSKSMLKKEQLPKLVEACEQSKSLDAHKQEAECIVKASTAAELKACDLDAVIKPWFKRPST